ncbi:MFS transporter [Chitinimonas arctica]|uniref:MFS transporter n=1 Tax=Chitinimonas arctica TaxID=2594795 RepID=A0A516SI65_9NEIS|nr:MFS transporter [Chitinimonas arctica]QDQ27840.1 MFS transporter [Chitinimonas arctica]
MTQPSLWRHVGFRRLYLSTVGFSLGTQVYQLAMPLILYELTRSAAAMTAMRAIELLPNLLLAMFIGVWADRIDRGRWARLAIAGMVVLMGVQVLLLEQGAAALPFFFITAFVLMTLNYLYAICRMGMIKEMLPEPLLLPATGQLTVVNQLFAVLGPALAGGLLAWRLELGLWLPMAAMLLAAWLLRSLPLPARRIEASGFWQDWREGWRVLVRNRPLWHLAWLVVLINGSVGVVEVLFLFRARDQLQLGPGELGLLYGLAGVGGVAGGMLCSRLRQRFGLGRLLMMELLLESACVLVLAWSDSLPLLLLALAANSFGGVIGNVCIWGYRQESTDSRYIGRISGLTGSMFKLLMPATLVLSGGLAASLPLAYLLSACAGAHLLAVLGTRVSAIYRVA